MGNYNDVLLEQLADEGDGFYAYVDDVDEARRLFVDDLTGTLQSVALDAKAQVDFDRDAVEAYRLVGYENRAIADDQFRDDGVDAGAIGAGHAGHGAVRGPADRRDGPGDRIATVGLRWIDPRRAVRRSSPRTSGWPILPRRSVRTPATFKLDALVAATAERVRGSPWGGTYRLKDVLAVADELANELPRTEEVHGFLDLLSKATTLER